MLRSLRTPLLAAVGLAVLLLIPSPAPLVAQTANPFFYYYRGVRVPLTLNAAQVLVRFNPAVGDAARRAAAEGTGDIKSFDARIDEKPLSVSLLPVSPGHDPLLAIEKLKRRLEVRSAGRVFRFADGGEYGETDEFVVRFKPDIPAVAIGMFNLANGVEIARQDDFRKGVLILRPVSGNTHSALDLANTYAESDWVEFAEPNFVIVEPQLTESPAKTAPRSPVTPSDTLFPYQWSLQNEGQFQGSLAGVDIGGPRAWGVTSGASQIKIAIIDEGVDATNPDLAGKVLKGYSSLDGSSNTQPGPNDYHGTAVAGIAAANSNNGQGIAGVCWFCQILPVRVAFEDANGNWVTTTSQLAAGIDWAWANGADVLSNSWVMSSPSSDVTNSIVNARFGGRGGYGSTVVFAAGNSNASTVPYPASLSNYVIAVGASNWCDQRKTPSGDICNDGESTWGSNYGSNLELLAPGQAIMTSCNGADCFKYFSGTSASAPLVAGMVGLLYSMNPNLQPQDIENALQLSAHDLPPAGRDNQSGYGRVDAYSALSALFDVGIGLRDNNPLAHPGDLVQYTVNYSNSGITEMKGTALTLTLPAGLDYLGSSPAFTSTGEGLYQLSLGTLPRFAGGTATLTAKVQAGTEGQTLTVSSQIAGVNPELDMSDNTSDDSIVVAQTNLFFPLIGR